MKWAPNYHQFTMNGLLWKVVFVQASSKKLIDRLGTYTLATTDPKTLTIYVSSRVSEQLLPHVIIHELGHCAMYSFNLLDTIHSMVYPQYWIEAEEWVCNFLADYGYKIFSVAYSILGNDAWIYIPQEYEKLIV